MLFRSPGREGTDSAVGAPLPSAIAGSSPEIAVRAVARDSLDAQHSDRMAFIEADSAEAIRAAQKEYETKRANLEKFLTYDQSVAGKFHDQKANRALEALQTEHELSLKNIENEAGASLDAEKEKHKARIKRMKKEDDPEDTTPEETTATQKKAIAGVVEEAKAKNKLHDQKMADIEKVHEAEKRNVEDISAAKLRAQEKKLQLAEQGMQRELRMAEDLARMHVSDLQQAQRGQARWLGQEARDQQKAAGLRNGGVRQIGGAIRGLGGSQDGRDIQRIGGGIFGMGGAGPRRTQEIGRASCRERV